MENTFSIADLAREFDVTTRTIRFYEDKGLISPRREGTRRIYTSRDRTRLRLIMRGKRLGFSLEEILDMIDLYDSDPTEVRQLKAFIEKLRERQKALRQQQRDIADVMAELETRENECQALLETKLGKDVAV